MSAATTQARQGSPYLGVAPRVEAARGKTRRDKPGYGEATP